MYYYEWLQWRVMLDSEENRKKNAKENAEFDMDEMAVYEQEILDNQELAKSSACNNPLSRGPVYELSENILEMRCGLLEPHRGYITLFTTILIGVTLTMAYLGVISLAPDLNNLGKIPEYANPFIWYASPALCGVGVATGVWVYWKFGFTISRMELFTSRHLLVRFNRKDQQVYLHRPKSCGGIAVLPWKGIISSAADPDIPEIAGADITLVLSWPSTVTNTHHPEYIFVGRRGKNQSELRREWEFIRRFMDEGPEGLPRPRITSSLPLPMQAFSASFEGSGHFYRNANKAQRLGFLLISPALIWLGVCHWASLILCWTPHWPKIIREAGLPGKPVPPQKKFSDYPLHIQQRLLENAYLWAPRPGKRPEKAPTQSDDICHLITESGQ